MDESVRLLDDGPLGAASRPLPEPRSGGSWALSFKYVLRDARARPFGWRMGVLTVLLVAAFIMTVSAAP